LTVCGQASDHTATAACVFNGVACSKNFTYSFIHSFISLLPANVKTQLLLHVTKTYYDYVTRSVSNSIKIHIKRTCIHRTVCKY